MWLLGGELRGEERGQLDLKYECSGLMLRTDREQKADDGAYWHGEPLVSREDFESPKGNKYQRIEREPKCNAH